MIGDVEMSQGVKKCQIIQVFKVILAKFKAFLNPWNIHKHDTKYLIDSVSGYRRTRWPRTDGCARPILRFHFVESEVEK